jgi:hypothetical protein
MAEGWLLFFCSIWVFTCKKQSNRNFIKYKNKIETGSNQTISVRFSYFILKTKTQPTGFGLVRFGFGLVRLRFGSIWLFYIKNQKLYCYLGFFFTFLMGLVSVKFGFFSSVQFFSFKLMKPNKTEYFLKYSKRFNRFFPYLSFFSYFVFSFLSLIGFLNFLLTSTWQIYLETRMIWV